MAAPAIERGRGRPPKPAHKWTITELADACGVSTRTAVKRLSARGIVADEEGRYLPPRAALMAVLDIQAPAASEKERFDRARAEAQEMKNAEARGEFAPVTELARIGTEIVGAVRGRVLAMRTIGPAVRATGSDGEAADLIESSARDALEDIARLADLAGEHRRRKRADAALADGGTDELPAASEADDESVG